MQSQESRGDDALRGQPPLVHHDQELSAAAFPERSVTRLSRSLSTNWEKLALLSFEAPKAALEPYLPKGTELDLFEGEARLSVVGFQFRRSKMCGITSPKLFDFSEVNLRSYVRGPDGTPGVIFVKELCPSRLACLLGRFLFNESFQLCPTAFSERSAAGSTVYRYEWGSGRAKSFVEVEAPSGLSAIQPGSEGAFVGGRCFGFSKQKDGSTLKFEVSHRPWKISSASRAVFDIKGEEYYPGDLAAALRRPPSSAFIMDGSGVEVFKHNSI